MINNTDIFTRLDWLTNRVNRILGALQNGGGGGGGSQTIDQVLATGSTATNKSLLMNDTLGVFPSSIGIGSTFGSQSGDIAGIKLEGPNGNFINVTNTSYLTKLGIDFTEKNNIDGTGIRGFYGRSQFGITSITTADYFFIGTNNGYNNELGYTLNNNSGATNSINAGNISISSINKTAVYTSEYINYSDSNSPGAFIQFNTNGIYASDSSSTSQIGITGSTLNFAHNVPGGATINYLTIDTLNQIYNFGDADISHGLFINSASNAYFLGDMGSGSKGVTIDLTSNNYYLGNQDGANFRVNDTNTSSLIVTSFPGGGESGLGLFNNIGHYQLGDFGGTAQPDTYNVYLDVSTSKSDSSIKTYYSNQQTGLLLDFNLGRYVFNMPNLGSGDAWFGMKTASGTGGVDVPCLDMTYSILGSPATAIPSQFSWIRVDVQGTRFWIPLYSDNT